jgi:outer membrane lipoprotein-sorting protein
MRSIVTALISIFAVQFAAAEAQKPVEELFAKMRKAYAAIQTAEMEVKVRNQTQNGQQTGRFSVKYAHPNKIRYVADVGANHLERFCDGKLIVTIRNDNRISDKVVNVLTLGAGLPGNLEWLSLFDWKHQLSTTLQPDHPRGQKGNTMAFSTFKLIPKETWNKKNWIVLEETAKDLNTKVRYFIDPKTFLIWRCDVSLISTRKEAGHTEVTKLVLGAKFDPKIFVAPKEGK